MSKNPWAKNPWFESVAVAQQRAKKRLPSSVYGALVAGSERGQSMADNEAAFMELGFAPHVAGHQAKRDQATTVMGQEISLPVIMSPTGVQAVHPDGEVAVARAAAARGTVIGLSNFASRPVEEVVAANPATFFQMYWTGDRDVMIQRMDRARAAGAVGLIATLDWSFSMGRDWGSPEIPEKVDFKTALKFAPQVLRKPRWLKSFAGNLPDLTAPNLAAPGEVEGADVLRRLLRVDDHDPAVVGGRGVDARGVGWPVHAQGCVPGRRRPARGRCRGHRDLGVQPRGQQPRRHPRTDPCAAVDRRGRRSTTSRCCSTAASGAAATSSRPSRSVLVP